MLRNMNKALLSSGVFLITLSLFSCSVRTFHIASDPSNTKVYYQTRRDKVFKGYTPVSFEDQTNNISPASKVILEKEGYTSTEVNVGGFTGTDVSLQVKLNREEDFTQAIKKDTPLQKEEPEDSSLQGFNQKTEPKKDLTKIEHTPQPITEEYEALRRRLEETEAELRALKEQQVREPIVPEAPTGDEVDDSLVTGLESEPENKGFNQNQISMNKALQHVFKAQELLNSGDLISLDAALVETFKALNINTKFAFAYAVQGTIYYKKNDYVAALDSWEKSIREDPTNLDVVKAYNKLKATLGTAMKERRVLTN